MTTQPAGETVRWHHRDLLVVCGLAAAAWSAVYLLLRVLRGIFGVPPAEPLPYVATDGIGQLQEVVLAVTACVAVVAASRRRGIGPGSGSPWPGILVHAATNVSGLSSWL